MRGFAIGLTKTGKTATPLSAFQAGKTRRWLPRFACKRLGKSALSACLCQTASKAISTVLKNSLRTLALKIIPAISKMHIKACSLACNRRAWKQADKQSSISPRGFVWQRCMRCRNRETDGWQTLAIIRKITWATPRATATRRAIFPRLENSSFEK